MRGDGWTGGFVGWVGDPRRHPERHEHSLYTPVYSEPVSLRPLVPQDADGVAPVEWSEDILPGILAAQQPHDDDSVKLMATAEKDKEEVHDNDCNEGTINAESLSFAVGEAVSPRHQNLDHVSLRTPEQSPARNGSCPPDSIDRSITPASITSTASSLRKLEWDAAADVGYRPPSEVRIPDHPGDLSTIERMALMGQYPPFLSASVRSEMNLTRSDQHPPQRANSLSDLIPNREDRGACAAESEGRRRSGSASFLLEEQDERSAFRGRFRRSQRSLLSELCTSSATMVPTETQNLVLEEEEVATEDRPAEGFQQQAHADDGRSQEVEHSPSEGSTSADGSFHKYQTSPTVAPVGEKEHRTKRKPGTGSSRGNRHRDVFGSRSVDDVPSVRHHRRSWFEQFRTSSERHWEAYREGRVTRPPSFFPRMKSSHHLDLWRTLSMERRSAIGRIVQDLSRLTDLERDIVNCYAVSVSSGEGVSERGSQEEPDGVSRGGARRQSLNSRLPSSTEEEGTAGSRRSHHSNASCSTAVSSFYFTTRRPKERRRTGTSHAHRPLPPESTSHRHRGSESSSEASPSPEARRGHPTASSLDRNMAAAFLAQSSSRGGTRRRRRVMDERIHACAFEAQMDADTEPSFHSDRSSVEEPMLATAREQPRSLTEETVRLAQLDLGYHPSVEGRRRRPHTADAVGGGEQHKQPSSSRRRRPHSAAADVEEAVGTARGDDAPSTVRRLAKEVSRISEEQKRVCQHLSRLRGHFKNSRQRTFAQAPPWAIRPPWICPAPRSKQCPGRPNTTPDQEHLPEGGEGNAVGLSEAATRPAPVAFFVPLEEGKKLTKVKKGKHTLEEILVERKPKFVKHLAKRAIIREKDAAISRRKWLQQHLQAQEAKKAADEDSGNASEPDDRQVSLEAVKTIVSYAEMRRETTRKYKQLPEVRNKQATRVKAQEKSLNRILAQIYKERLLKEVLNGKIYHTHSDRVLCTLSLSVTYRLKLIFIAVSQNRSFCF
ncbi:unnamed protein product [Cyprideis torosa]|uniref:Uncharacterized protein n=1 Tax=Cyprideis torosa TaxID=163714 RepID=A0A7R8ZNT5_9CRUS|nr:unnamed protein product [Cyprideis torosa]CAG0887070.1 unnamed protein product [Cyprideis torosa]